MDISEIKLPAPKRLRKKYITVSLLAIAYWFTDVFRFGMRSLQINVFYEQLDFFISDLTQVIGYSAYPDPYNCREFLGLLPNYPPLNYVLLRNFAPIVDINSCFTYSYTKESNTPLLLIVYFLIVTVIMCCCFSVIRKETEGSTAEKRLTAVVLILSAPVFCVVERGNIVMLAALLTMFFIFNHNSEKKVIKELALIALGFAFGLKLTPAVFGFLLLYNKQYKEAVRASVYGLLFIFVPFLFMNGGLANFPLMIRNLGIQGSEYYSTNNCALWACFRYFGIDIYKSFWKYIACAYILICSFFIRRKWEKVLALSLVMFFALDFSGSYCILYLFPVVVMFLNEKEYEPLDRIAFLGFLDLFILMSNPFNSPVFIRNIFDKIFDIHLGVLLLTLVILIKGTRDTVISLIELSAKKKPELLQGKVYLFFTGSLKPGREKKPADTKAARVRLIVLLSILAVVVAATVAVTVNPDIPKEFARQRAIGLYEKGEYDEAFAAFERLYDYKDCREYADKCKAAMNES